MLRTHSNRASAASAAAMLLLCAAISLAACGGSGKGTSQTNASASTSKTDPHSAPTGKGGAQDSGGTPAGGATKGGGKAPSSAGKAAGVPSGAALARFAACLRKNGVTLPPAGKGSASGVDTKSAQYKAAAAKCARELAGSGGLHLGGSVHFPTPKLSKAQLKKLNLSKIHLKNIHVKVNPGDIHVKVSPDKLHTGLPKVEQPPTGAGTPP